MEMLNLKDWKRPGQQASLRVRDGVRDLLDDIRERGDDAIDEYSQRFDGYKPEFIKLKAFEDYDLSPSLRKALLDAAARIEGFAKLQKSMYHDVNGGDASVRYGHKVLPLDRMAAYIPGGRYPLVSTAMMTLIPARVAGVAERIAVTPTDHPAVQAAASLAGATAMVRMGGSQAIAAVAYGYRDLAPVDMVVGPGNAYVNEAKAQLQDTLKIDTLAGPSEILVLCDDTIDPNWVALDLLAQAEHDPMALSVVGSNNKAQLEAIATAVEEQAKQFPEKDKGIIQLVYCADGEEMVALSNKMGPEHLHVAVGEGLVDLDALRHYGSLFVGAHSAVALGDYCTGPNHTLPTVGVARQKGGLMVGDFLKIVTWQEAIPSGYEPLAKTAIELATVEDLDYHRLSLEVRR